MVQSERSLRDITEHAAAVVAALGALLIILAVLAELFRRRHCHLRCVALADQLLPTVAQRFGVALVTVLSAVTALIAPPAASADTSIRDWLTDPTTTTTRLVSGSAPLIGPSLRVDQPAPATPSTSVPAPVPPAPALVMPSDPTAGIEPSAPAPSPARDTYQVVPGDCLWSIAVRVLGGHASLTAIDRGWRAIYAANRAAIGDDPNLIHAGVSLTIPLLAPTP